MPMTNWFTRTENSLFKAVLGETESNNTYSYILFLSSGVQIRIPRRTPERCC